MKRFEYLLQKTGERLDIPQPAKSRILLEMAGDLEHLYHYYVGIGFNEEEATKRAEEKIGASDETISLLIQMNDSAVKKLLRKYPVEIQRKIKMLSWGFLIALLNCTAFIKWLSMDMYYWPNGYTILVLLGIALVNCSTALKKFISCL
ncbi:hypothetical protein ACFL6I_07505 [candidate division KSB1 bacterium]